MHGLLMQHAIDDKIEKIIMLDDDLIFGEDK